MRLVRKTKSIPAHHWDVVLLSDLLMKLSHVGAVPMRRTLSSGRNEALGVEQGRPLQHGVPHVPDEDLMRKLDVVHVKVKMLNAGIVHPIVNYYEVYLQIDRQNGAELVVKNVGYVVRWCRRVDNLRSVFGLGEKKQR